MAAGHGRQLDWLAAGTYPEGQLTQKPAPWLRDTVLGGHVTQLSRTWYVPGWQNTQPLRWLLGTWPVAQDTQELAPDVLTCSKEHESQEVRPWEDA